MKQLLVILMAALMITACKKSETTDTSTTSVQYTASANAAEMPVNAEQPKLIELSNVSAEEFATKYDDLLKELVEADMKKDKAAVLALKPKFEELDKAIDENAAKLSGKESDTFNGFLGKRKSTAQNIIANY